MKPEYKEIEMLKTKLFHMRLDISKKKKSPPWQEADLWKVLKSLKKGKCPDLLGMSYELLMPENIGSN